MPTPCDVNDEALTLEQKHYTQLNQIRKDIRAFIKGLNEHRPFLGESWSAFKRLSRFAESGYVEIVQEQGEES